MVTVCADLSSTAPITLCQNINLVAGSQYILSYDIYAFAAIQNITARAYLNSILLT